MSKVNITERDSEILMENGERFVEQCEKGMWKRALNKATSIPMLLNHNWNKQIASTEDTLELYEDNIGLRFAVDISEPEAIKSIKEKGLSGCSFGFRALRTRKEESSKGIVRRFLEDIELLEVSLLSGKIAAYTGSLAEVRAEGEKSIEIRMIISQDEEDTNDSIQIIKDDYRVISKEEVRDLGEIQRLKTYIYLKKHI